MKYIQHLVMISIVVACACNEPIIEERIIGEWYMIESTMLGITPEDVNDWKLQINTDGYWLSSYHGMETPGTYRLYKETDSYRIELIPDSDWLAIENYIVTFEENGDMLLSDLEVRTHDSSQYQQYGYYSKYRRSN